MAVSHSCASLPRILSICATGRRKSSDNRVHTDHVFLEKRFSGTQKKPRSNSGSLRQPMRCREHISLPSEVSMTGPFRLAPLPWDEDALAPIISANTIRFHYHKHHQTYVDTLNTLVTKTRFAEMRLEEIIRAAAGDAKE